MCRFDEVLRELEVVGGIMLKRSGMEKVKKVKEKALYERMKTQIIQGSTRTPVKNIGKRITKESEPRESK